MKGLICSCEALFVDASGAVRATRSNATGDGGACIYARALAYALTVDDVDDDDDDEQTRDEGALWMRLYS